MPEIILKINHAEDKIYQSDNICCYIADANLPQSVVDNIIKTGKMFLLFGAKNAEQVKSMQAAGAVVSLDSSQPIKKQLRPLRENLGAKKVLGAIIEPSRHEAMLASEVEPEFVAFRITAQNQDKARDIIAWYNDLFLIQSAADFSGGVLDISDLDVDFVIINSHDYNDFSC